MRRIGAIFALALVVALLAATAVLAAPAQAFPKVLPLPNGFQPEGIAVGRGTDFYVGSLVDGAIYKGDLRTGEGAVLIGGQAGRSAAGLEFDERTGYLFVAGALSGFGYVYDTRTGQQVAAFSLSGPGGFINDVVVTRTAAYFTSSFAATLYRVPLLPGGGLPDPVQVQPLPLGGDWQQQPGDFVFNANGIEATPDCRWLIVVNSTVGALYRVDPDTGQATLIDLHGDTVANGDGLLLHGHTLYVARNVLNEIAVVELAPDLASGQVQGAITDPAFRVPTTIDEFGPYLYAVNARFDVPAPDANTEYEVVQVHR